MGYLVQETYRAAQCWQENVLWIRVNIGYMTAELDYIKREGTLGERVEGLLGDFTGHFQSFSDAELEAFTGARRLESEDTPKNRQEMIEVLEKVKRVFLPWFEKFDDAVVASEETSPEDPGLPLLLCCGAEMMKAHTAYRKVLDGFQAEISDGAV